MKEVGQIISEMGLKKEKMMRELDEVERQLKGDLEKYKELGSKHSINTSGQESNYTLDRQNNIFDITDFKQ